MLDNSVTVNDNNNNNQNEKTAYDENIEDVLQLILKMKLNFNLILYLSKKKEE